MFFRLVTVMLLLCSLAQGSGIQAEEFEAPSESEKKISAFAALVRETLNAHLLPPQPTTAPAENTHAPAPQETIDTGLLGHPDEIWLSIFGWLAPADLRRCRQVCGRFNRLAHDAALTYGPFKSRQQCELLLTSHTRLRAWEQSKTHLYATMPQPQGGSAHFVYCLDDLSMPHVALFLATLRHDANVTLVVDSEEMWYELENKWRAWVDPQRPPQHAPLPWPESWQVVDCEAVWDWELSKVDSPWRVAWAGLRRADMECFKTWASLWAIASVLPKNPLFASQLTSNAQSSLFHNGALDILSPAARLDALQKATKLTNSLPRDILELFPISWRWRAAPYLQGIAAKGMRDYWNIFRYDLSELKEPIERLQTLMLFTEDVRAKLKNGHDVCELMRVLIKLPTYTARLDTMTYVQGIFSNHLDYVSRATVMALLWQDDLEKSQAAWQMGLSILQHLSSKHMNTDWTDITSNLEKIQKPEERLKFLILLRLAREYDITMMTRRLIYLPSHEAREAHMAQHYATHTHKRPRDVSAKVLNTQPPSKRRRPQG